MCSVWDGASASLVLTRELTIVRVFMGIINRVFYNDEMSSQEKTDISSPIQLYFNRYSLTILLLGFSSGLPLVLVTSTLQAWYTSAGVSLMTIGSLSLIGQPYIWKFLWAPFFDRFSIFKFERRRGWIMAFQIFLALGMAAMAFQAPKNHPWLLASLALVTAFFSASQDTAIDAYRTDVLPDRLRGVGAAMTSLGYRLALLVSGALALMIAYKIGWRITYLIMSSLMLLSIFATQSAPGVTISNHAPLRLKEAILKPFFEFLNRPYSIIIIAFIITYKISDALALALNTYFLLHFLKFSLMDLGVITKVAGLIGVVMGGLVGGTLYPSLGLYRSLLYFGLLQTLAALLFAVLTLVGKSYWLMAVSIFFENFCSGLSSVACIIYLTTLCNVNYTATQYALFSAIASFGRVYVGPVAALLVKHIGWFDFYIVSFFAGFLPLILLKWLHNKKSQFL